MNLLVEQSEAKMKLLNVVSLLNLLTVVPVVSAYGYGGWHTGFKPIVSGSSAQRADDRWGNSNQIHGKRFSDSAVIFDGQDSSFSVGVWKRSSIKLSLQHSTQHLTSSWFPIPFLFSYVI